MVLRNFHSFEDFTVNDRDKDIYNMMFNWYSDFFLSLETVSLLASFINVSIAKETTFPLSAS